MNESEEILIESKINFWDIDYIPSDFDLQIEKERRLHAESLLINKIIKQNNNLSNTTLKDVKKEAMASINALRNGKIDVKTASEIRNNLIVIVECAKTEVEFINALPDEIKKQKTKSDFFKIAETVISNDVQIDTVLSEIEDNNKKPYLISNGDKI